MPKQLDERRQLEKVKSPTCMLSINSKASKEKLVIYQIASCMSLTANLWAVRRGLLTTAVLLTVANSQYQQFEPT